MLALYSPRRSLAMRTLSQRFILLPSEYKALASKRAPLRVGPLYSLAWLALLYLDILTQEPRAR